jgi:hypothetical protein
MTHLARGPAVSDGPAARVSDGPAARVGNAGWFAARLRLFAYWSLGWLFHPGACLSHERPCPTSHASGGRAAHRACRTSFQIFKLVVRRGRPSAVGVAGFGGGRLPTGFTGPPPLTPSCGAGPLQAWFGLAILRALPVAGAHHDHARPELAAVEGWATSQPCTRITGPPTPST